MYNDKGGGSGEKRQKYTTAAVAQLGGGASMTAPPLSIFRPWPPPSALSRYYDNDLPFKKPCLMKTKLKI